LNKIEQYQNIKQAYNDFRLSLLKEGKLPLRETAAGFWGTSVCDELFSLFKRIKLHKYRSFIDLGSGDGRAVLIASLFTAAKGIELDLQLYKKALEINKRLGLKAHFLQQDFFNHDIKGYDVVFCYPDNPLYYGLSHKLKQELSGRFVMYGPELFNLDLKKIDSFRIQGTFVNIFDNLPLQNS
jgi:hypothetical protein